MEILIQSLVGIADQTSSPIHVRYFHRQGDTVGSPDTGGTEHLAVGSGGGGKKKSIIVIRQPYAFLQPSISSMFQGAEDVQVIVDRRFHDRRQRSSQVAEEQRGTKKDRRGSIPMLDVLINIEG